MNKSKVIAQLLALLQDASAEQCDIVLTFVEHMTNKARDDKTIGKAFIFDVPDAMETAYIVQRSQGNPRLLHEILIHARAFEKVSRDKAEQANKE